MWKNCNRFYNQVLKSETLLVAKSKNVHGGCLMEKISLTSVSRGNSSTKRTLLNLSCLQLVANKKGRVVLSKRSQYNSKLRKGTGLGFTLLLRRGFSFQFLLFYLFNILSQSSTARLLAVDQSQSISLSIGSILTLTRVRPNFGQFQHLDNVQVLFSFNGVYNKNAFFLRLFKFPIKSF